MKNVFKKLFSLMLVAVMLVSVLPMTALAAEGDPVTVIVKDESGDFFNYPNNTGLKLEEYLTWAVGSNWADTYEVKNYNVVDGETGKDTSYGTDGSKTVYVPGSTVRIKLAHKPVDVYVYITLDGAKLDKAFSFKAPYGSSVKLDTSLVTRFIDANISSDSISYSVQGTGETYGSFTADQVKYVDITATTVKEGNPGGGEGEGSDETETKKITWTVKIGDDEFEGEPFAPKDGKTTVENILNYKYDSNWSKTYKLADHYYLNGKTVYDVKLSDTIKAGDSIAIRLVKKSNTNNPDNTPNPPSTSAQKTLTVQVKYGNTVLSKDYTYNQYDYATITGNMVENIFSGYPDDYMVDEIDVFETNSGKARNDIGLGGSVYMDVHMTVVVDLNKRPVNNGGSDKWAGTLFLHIYRDGKIDKEYKYYSSDDYSGVRSLMTDGVITKDEIIENFLPKYFSVIDSTKGFQVDGLYWDTDFQKNFANDSGKFDTLNLDTMITKARGISHNQNIHVSLMLTNAKAKTSSKADSSNPKTGDEIFMTVTIMAVTATALAGAYLLNKKRMVK